jgi:hypothetical protein
MPISFLFWGIYILSIVFFWFFANDGQPLWYRRAGAVTALWILVGILGYRVFGAAVK